MTHHVICNFCFYTNCLTALQHRKLCRILLKIKLSDGKYCQTYKDFVEEKVLFGDLCPICFFGKILKKTCCSCNDCDKLYHDQQKYDNYRLIFWFNN
ncbi:TPA_asm: Oncoid3 [Manila clam xenomavirus]|nr:TPA_asm: Oncoid3 [Manila clam xenomavirus]